MKKSMYMGASIAVFSLSLLTAAQTFASPVSLPLQATEHIPVCPPSGLADVAHCHARVVVDHSGKPNITAGPVGYGPTQFRTAYNLTSSSGSSSQIIAIVDAYDHPTIQSDLDTYSATFGVPSLPTCNGPVVSSSVSCFQKIDQRGGTNYPVVNSGWALEIALDVETAHAVCPGCSILLVEADSNSFADLFSAVDRAAQMGATRRHFFVLAIMVVAPAIVRCVRPL